jgi:hypothetical protein
MSGSGFTACIWRRLPRCSTKAPLELRAGAHYQTATMIYNGPEKMRLKHIAIGKIAR